MYHFFQGLLEGVSHSFTKDFTFIDSVKAYLSYALLRASVSQPPAIFQVLVLFFSFSSLHIKFWSIRRSYVFSFFLWIGSMQQESSMYFCCGLGNVLKYEWTFLIIMQQFSLNMSTSFHFDLFMLNDYFQGEIGIFFPLIILRSLEGTECPLNQKLSVLQ